MYKVLTPVYRQITADNSAISWIEVGVADSMAEAKERFGGHPVLERVR